MKPKNRPTKETYYFSVEGDTEKWYLDWLQNAINNDPNCKIQVKLNSKAEKNPISYVKSLTILGKTEITHVFDRESTNKEHTEAFLKTLDGMKTAEKCGKNVKYLCGYSNYTFDLWIILHKKNCRRPYTNRAQYLDAINDAFHEKFESMNKYKEESNFKKVLSKLTLDDVCFAIKCAEQIEKDCFDNGYTQKERNGYRYYDENPSILLHKQIAKILEKAGLKKI